MPSNDRSPRQTLTYLRDLFEARGLQPKNKLGQSFLIDLNLLELIVRSAELSPPDLVLEVGTGTGSLTARLAAEAGLVLGVELDAGFYQLARDNTAAFTNVTLINADILKNKNHLNPTVLETLEKLRGADGHLLKLVSNLPYVVATPVITNLLLTELPFERFVVTIQWEVAERLVARPSTKNYGSLSVLVQTLADVEVIRRLPPHAFWPRPQVESGLVLIRPNAEKRRRVGDLLQFRSFLRDLYTHRRKNLRGALAPAFGKLFTKPALDEHLRKHGFDPTGRAEALTVEQHHQLHQVMRPALS